MARYLSPEWVQAFDAALSALDLADVVEAAGQGSLAAADGAFSVAQQVHGVPPDLGLGTEVCLVLSVAEGRAHLALADAPDAPATAPATATIALDYPEALSLALGELDPADALADGRVRVRGDLAALVAGQEVLAAAATRLGDTLVHLTDPIEPSEPSAASGPAADDPGATTA